MERVRTLAKKLSNWGRWGPEDELGTLNFITPEAVRRGAACARKGKVFSLGLALNAQGPQAGTVPGRFNPIHTMSLIKEKVGEHFCYADDMIVMPLQCATQFDSLAHVYYDGKLYNGYPEEVVTSHGAVKNGIEKVAERGVVSRGVLLDMARHAGAARLEAGCIVTPEQLEDAEKKAGLRVQSGDVLLLRTGWIDVFKAESDRMKYMSGEPGIGLAALQWLHEREVAAICADTMAVEAFPGDYADLLFPVHLLAIRDMGLTLGEMFDLDALAEDCAADGVWDFLFTAPALKVTGGIGTPLNPLAVK